MAEARRALLAPLLSGAADDALLELAVLLRRVLHEAYSEAADLPAGKANFILRIRAVGADARTIALS